MDALPPDLLGRARTARTVTVLSGAGISAESGVPAFRDAGTGLWARWSPEELATPEAWEADPGPVWCPGTCGGSAQALPLLVPAPSR